MAQTRNEFINWLTALAVQDGAVVIAPWEAEFRPKTRDFLEGIRRIPSRISAPEGRDPFQAMLFQPGSFLIVWVPDD